MYNVVMMKCIFLALLFCCLTQVSSQTNEKKFELYDAIAYQGKPDLRPQGLLPINLIYEASLTKPDPANSKGIVLDLDKIDELAEMSSLFPDLTVSTDIEHWFSDSSIDEYEMLYRFSTLFSRFRAANPDVFIGNYGLAPSALCVYRFYDGGKKDEGTLLRDWRSNNQKRLKSLQVVDAAMPSVYIAEPNIESWIKDLQTTVAEIRKYTDKKIIVYIWPQYYDKADSPYFREFVSSEIWSQMLEAVYQNCDGAIIWSSTKDKNDNSIHWNQPEVQAMWNATKNFMATHQANLKSPEPDPELIVLDNPEKKFKLFNAITYSNTPDLRTKGFYEFQQIIESQVTTSLVNNVYEPDSAKIATLAKSLLSKPDVPVGVKAGTWIRDRGTDNVAMVARHEKFKRIFRRHNPHNPIGFFTTTPSSLSGLRVTNSNPFVNQSSWKISAAIPTRPVREHVDILLPASYIIDDDTTTWKREFYLTVAEAKKNNTGKPIYAHFYVDYFNQAINFSNYYKPISNKATFRTMLEAAFKICDGVVLTNVSSQYWNSNYGFWNATQEFMEAHKDNIDFSTGIRELADIKPSDAFELVDKTINIKGNYNSISVYDLMGKRVCLYQNPAVGLKIPLTKNGVYLLKIDSKIFKVLVS
jgi:hypothetical protein